MQIGRCPSPQPPQRAWTVLVWSASDNDLHDYNLNDLDEAELTGPNPHLSLVAQVDHGLTGGGAQRLELRQDSQPGLHSEVKAELGQTNMADPKNLTDFIKWGMQNYPAEHYWLVISDHGDGWKGACQDDSADGWMSLPMLEQGLREAREATGRKLDVLSFDCCLMGSAEVAHQLQNEAHYLVGSQEVMGYKGLPYHQVLDPAGRFQLTPRALVERLVRLSTQDQEDMPTLSALDLTRAPDLAPALQAFGEQILASGLSGERLRQLVGQTQDFSGYKDVFDLAERLAEADPSLRESAEQVKAAVSGLVVAEQHSPGYPGAHGVQIEVNPDTPESRLRYRFTKNGKPSTQRLDKVWTTQQDAYRDTALAQDTDWERVIAHIHQP